MNVRFFLSAYYREDKGYCSLFDKRFKYKQANSIEKDVHIVRFCDFLVLLEKYSFQRECSKCESFQKKISESSGK